MPDDFHPIEAYGLIGNLRTCALVGPDGSVDWYPVPHLESSSPFAAILDSDRGGHFHVGPAAGVEGTQRYVDRTNVLRTTFETDDWAFETTDFLAPTELSDVPSRALYRKVECTRGDAVTVDVTFAPRPEYGQVDPTIRTGEGELHAETADGPSLRLSGDVAFSVTDEATAAVADADLSAGDARWLVLRERSGDDSRDAPDRATCERALERTVEYWREWAHDHANPDEDPGTDECIFGGPYHDAVVRSGLVLKLLAHEETGAIAAAPTTSLPEEFGGVRNWDYRYTWPRDAAFTVQALAHLGHFETADAYFRWFLDVCNTEPENIQPLYGLHGEVDLTECELDHLRGYRDSRPVRVGNAAVEQFQLDVFGELVLAIATARHHGWEVDERDWPGIRRIVDHVCAVWDEPDHGIWEVRTEPRHFVHSKLMCWVALDRGIAMAESEGWDVPLDSWRRTRSEVRDAILDRGFDENRNTFRQSFESDALDAATLLVPLVGFLPFDDDRVEGTLAAVRETLETDDGLVRRYDGSDGLPGDEGTFTLCSFWLVDALALSGRVDAARRRFDALLDYASPLGLFAEEVDLAEPGGLHRGNYPQAFSHTGVVNSALHLGRVRQPETPGPAPVGIWLGEGPAVPD